MGDQTAEHYWIWRRRSFFGSSSLLLGIGVSIASFGLLLPVILLLWFLHSRTSNEVWVEDGWLFDNKHLPYEGIDLAAVRAQRTTVSLFGLTVIERSLLLTYFSVADQRARVFAITQSGYGRKQFDDAMLTISRSIAEARLHPSEDAVECLAALDQLERRQRITPRRVFRLVAGLVALGAFGFAVIMQLVPISETSANYDFHEDKCRELRLALETERYPTRRSQLETEIAEKEGWMADLSDQLLLQRGVQGASLLVGLLAVGSIWLLRRPQAMPAI